MKLIIVNKHELQLGIEKESSEHGMSTEEARKTAIDHLKERPDYYSKAEEAGLEQEGLKEIKLTTGRLGGLKKNIKKKKAGTAWTAVGTSAMIG
jgi:hypothetical protein